VKNIGIYNNKDAFPTNPLNGQIAIDREEDNKMYIYHSGSWNLIRSPMLGSDFDNTDPPYDTELDSSLYDLDP
jgi:hypothetical protein